ncbi:hypothetical protein [Flammeovirga aprica]|uniref:VLRF1 domain-containing protein n=1 Tax=Flammeovirga aprica JL-4 TaxID=694437 RepID=A0A7X9P1S8_9BACT|nr:hypothetical protein [Flammeovirga aprica]NME67958.1 hypothetical protein [Flammeovirga aprica JL-4]
MPQRIIPIEKIETLLEKFPDHKEEVENAQNRVLSAEPHYTLRLPWHLNADLSRNHVVYVICIIQTESASVALVKNGKIVDHKTFSTYAVRKKQGKSQIKYLKTRGKSKAGSRLRLANTLNFFEHINERLEVYFKENNIERIAFSCSKILLPYLFTSKVKCPFEKKDERIYKIPKHIPNANFEDLQQIHKSLSKAEFSFEEKDLEAVDLLLSSIFNKDED